MNPLDAADLLFRVANALAMSGWLALAASPARMRWAPWARRWAGRGLPLLMGAAYVALIARHWGPGGYATLAEVRALFAVPGLLAAGWLHYLAFDLFVGAWIAERGAALGWPHALLLPLYAATFLFGPAGLLAYALARGVFALAGARAPSWVIQRS